MDIILGRARRPRSDEEKRAIVAETMVEGETVSSVARRHGINANMLFTWRKRFRLADGVVTISAAQLSYLLSGIDWRMPRETWRPQAAG